MTDAPIPAAERAIEASPTAYPVIGRHREPDDLIAHLSQALDATLTHAIM